MATVQVVVNSANEDTPAVGGLFEGISFFLVQRLPSRGTFVQKIQSNGGRVVKLEQQADHIIADHFRQDCPASSKSYTFIDAAIKDGALPDSNKHLAGPPPGTVREVGSAVQGKTTRTPFTAGDDRVLWQWVEQCKKKGGLVKGNDIYKQLEAKNSRHTYQAWRDRYIKRLMDRPPAGVGLTVAANPPPSPPTAQDEQVDIAAETSAQAPATVVEAGTGITQQNGIDGYGGRDTEPQVDTEIKPEEENIALDFTEDDLDLLLNQANDIEDISEGREDEAWDTWANAYPQHSAEAWREFYIKEVRPLHLERRAEDKAARRRKRSSRLNTTDAVADMEDVVETAGVVSATGAAQTIPMDVPSHRAYSPSSQKRKLKSDKPQEEEGHRQKRLKSATPERPTMQTQTQARITGVVSTQPIELLSSEDDEEQQDSAEVMLRSELNRAAQMQLDTVSNLDESESSSESIADLEVDFYKPSHYEAEVARAEHELIMSQVPTSALNRSAERQLRREYLEQNERVTNESARSEYRYWPEPTGEELGEMGSSADLLTEANLLSQQTGQKAQLIRGTDILEDDYDSEQQEEYIQYLQNIMKTAQKPRDPVLHTENDAAAAAAIEQRNEIALTSHKLPLSIDEIEQVAIGALPMSSQQEIDDAFDEGLNWPQSPVASQRKKAESQSLQFETQVGYPKLPSQHIEEVLQEHDENLFLSQDSVHQQINYPSLHQRSDDPSITQNPHTEVDVAPSPAAGRQSDVELDVESSHAVVEKLAQESSPSIESDKGEIDLAVPEPESGWENSSSPLKAMSPQRRTPHASQPVPREVDELEADVDIFEEEVYEVSSDTSSSSESSSDDLERIVAATLQERRKKALETQDILDAETQQPDLDMPLPPDSEADLEDLPSSSAEQLSSPHWPSSGQNWSTAEDKLLLRGIRKRMRSRQILRRYGIERSDSALRNRRLVLLKQFPLGRVPTTSDLYDSDDSDSEELLSDPLERSSSPLNAVTAESQRVLADTQKLPDEEINSYIDKMVVFGYKESAVIDALKCTSMRPDLAELVLLEEKAGYALPTDIAGIWSAEEDRILESGDGGGIRKLEEKHTWTEVMERMSFLQEWREEE